eukprot:3381733-Lingulodinium_polyedra.AAC.1
MKCRVNVSNNNTATSNPTAACFAAVLVCVDAANNAAWELLGWCLSGAWVVLGCFGGCLNGAWVALEWCLDAACPLLG